MGKRQRFSATFKFNVVREALMGERTEAEIARQHGVHPVTLSSPGPYSSSFLFKTNVPVCSPNS